METKQEKPAVKPTTVKAVDGTKINIENYRKSLNDFPTPSNARAVMDEYGNTALCGVTYQNPKCGCEITGCGTLQFPLMIKFCDKHKIASSMYKAMKDAKEEIRQNLGAIARTEKQNLEMLNNSEIYSRLGKLIKKAEQK